MDGAPGVVIARIEWRGRRFRPLLAVGAVLLAAPAVAQRTVPTVDTEDATLGSVAVDDGRVHGIATIDVRNGDYARGAFDDDDAGLGRVPFHATIGFAAVLHRDAGGRDTLFAIGQSSNGFHAPRADETASPRGWYESNNIVGLAWRPIEGLTGALAYAIKTSPNGVAATTHEASVTVAYTADHGVGRLKPRLAVTTRPKGADGTYTLVGIAPEFDLAAGPTVSVPVTVGIGWGGFYARDSGDRAFGSGGVAIEQPVRLGGVRATIRAEMLALVRDDRLRRLDAPGGTTATIVPLGTIALGIVW